MKSKEILEKTGVLPEYAIPGILEVLEWVGAGELKEAEAFPNQFGHFLEVKDISDRKYFLGLDEFGTVGIVRKDSMAGEVVFMPIE